MIPNQSYRDLIEKLFLEKAYKHTLAPIIRSQCPEIGGIYGTLLSLWAIGRARTHNKQTILIIPGNRLAENVFTDILSLSPNDNVFFYPDINTLPYEDLLCADTIAIRRLETMYHLMQGTPGLYICSTVSATRKIMPINLFKNSTLTIRTDKSVERERLIQYLVNYGYEKVTQVRMPGDYSVRGSLVDIFSPSMKYPIRIDYFDDEIEEIRTFDVITQKSITKIDKVVLVARREAWIDEETWLRKRNEIISKYGNEAYEKIEYKFQFSKFFPGILNYIPAFYPNCSTIIDYATDKSTLIVYNKNEILKRKTIIDREYALSYEHHQKRARVCIDPKLLFSNCDEILRKTKEEAQTLIDTSKETPVLNAKIGLNFKGDLSAVKKKLESYFSEGWTVLFSADHIEQAYRLGELFNDFKPIILDEKKIDVNASEIEKLESRFFIIQATLTGGIELPESKLVWICDYEIFGRKRKIHKRYSLSDPAKILESFIDINEGDYVVHINEGIGIYRGLKRMAVSGKEKDFLKIEYAGNSNLFIPVEQVNLIQKYIGSKGNAISLDHLGGTAWSKVKSRVRRAIEKIAQELVELYAKRKKFTKEPFPPDTYFQAEFEAEFPYSETPDQLSVVEAIKRDMESERPMDRLVCGDVGFGKTEVAMRAVFKSVVNGKQAAILVPTTILSEQHFRNFKKRFINYPITIEVLNRFQTSQQQTKIEKELKEGKVDILIGTHKILSKSIEFKNLGLLVIDEEQKFGVKHKEKIREFTALVDTLTLSATPIPRTLHMSLVNIREISVINTPPDERLAVQTYITEFNEEIIVDAIEKELSRKGQIYFIHNRVETIDQVAISLKNLVPHLRIGVGHGQMSEIQIEDVMENFLLGNIDMLICTTIVDSGLDIPNANTIFINNAENLGLSQLYQLKGRVGRSDRQSYAYLFYPKSKALSEVAMKRLNSIGEHTDLGSGLKIAMKDLEIRGAGNILGEAQSGDVMAVGFELYCKLLDEAVTDIMQNKKVGEHYDCILDIKYSGYIPDDYIPDNREKIEIYKKIAGIRNQAEYDFLNEEIVDRYGQPPDLLQQLFTISTLRIEANKIKICSITEKINKVLFVINEGSLIDEAKIIKILSRKDVRMVPGHTDTLELTIINQSDDKDKIISFNGKINIILDFLKNIAK